MSCEDALLLLHPYVDDELDLIHSLDIEKHLETCPTCSLAVKNHRALRSSIQGASLYYQTPRLRKLLPPAPNRRKTYSMIALAASLLIAAFLMGRLQPRENHTEQAILDSHLRSLMPGHLADVQSTDQHTVKPWFNGKLDFSPPVVDFAPRGFPLTGGRVDAIGGREVAVLIYRHGQHVINVYLWQSPGSRYTSLDKSAKQGYNVVQWTGADFQWWLISDLNVTELTNFAELLRAATR
jgi:anti-sigma factor RsiW